MKRYEVVVTPEAESEIVSAFEYIYLRSPQNATKWLRALYKKIDTLEGMPERCPIARENEYFDETLRQLIFKTHRIIFRVEKAKKIVRVLYVRHGRQRTMGEPEHADEAGDE